MRILIVGGDKRQEYMYDYYRQKGIYCDYIKNNGDSHHLKDTKKYDVIMLPVPLTSDGEKIYSSNKELNISVCEIIDKTHADQMVFSGNINARYNELLRKKSVFIYDFLKDDAFVKYNAYLTAQGALRLLLENTENYIGGKSVLVTGFGKVSKALCLTLESNRLNVSVCARKYGDLLLADTLGYECFSFDKLEAFIGRYDYIFGTVPTTVISEKAVESMKDEAVYFELASAPYGTKEEYFANHRKKFVLANALPGRFCAKSWSEKTAQYCLNLIERG